ncbi:MAG: hypothetical protein KatS3mg007_1405 [Thermoanaerobaculum sp.]|nr:MAG: hypothetical protein KatS3mg007_1405 [Thermoanaerobaculum sp.]
MAVRAQTNLRRGVAQALFIVLVAGVGWAQEATPTPPPVGLSDLARGIKLKLPPGTRKLDNEAVKRLGSEATLTKGPSAKEGASSLSTIEAWQKRYQEARARVLGLELFLEKARAQAYSPGSAASAVLQRSIRRAETELEIMRGAPEQVIKQALAAGGKREWFSDLPVPEPIFPSWVDRGQGSPQP